MLIVLFSLVPLLSKSEGINFFTFSEGYKATDDEGVSSSLYQEGKVVWVVLCVSCGVF
jgi:hypothetical protein